MKPNGNFNALLEQIDLEIESRRSGSKRCRNKKIEIRELKLALDYLETGELDSRSWYWHRWRILYPKL